MCFIYYIILHERKCLYIYNTPLAKVKYSSRPTISNRAASYEYHFIERYTAGIVLTGTEIKSVRAGKIQLQDAYCIFYGGELFVRNMQINSYDFGSYNNHDPKRSRKLLLTRKELRKLKSKSEESGTTVIPVKLFFNDRNFAKLDIALAKGKKTFDKRESIKERDVERQTRRGYGDD